MLSRPSALLKFLVEISPSLQSIKVNNADAGTFRLVVNDKKSSFELTQLRTIVQYFGHLEKIHDVSSAKVRWHRTSCRQSFLISTLQFYHHCTISLQAVQFVDIACSIIEGDAAASSLAHLDAHFTHNSFAAGDTSVADYALAFAISGALVSEEFSCHQHTSLICTSTRFLLIALHTTLEREGKEASV